MDLSLRFQEDYVNGRIPKESVKIVRYDRVMTDFDTLMNEILQFVGVEPSAELQQTVAETAVDRHLQGVVIGAQPAVPIANRRLTMLPQLAAPVSRTRRGRPL